MSTLIVVAMMFLSVGYIFIVNVHKSEHAHEMRIAEGIISGLSGKLETLNLDYARWSAALDNVKSANTDWVYANMGTGVTETQTVDIMVILRPDGDALFGWQLGSGEASNPKLLPARVINSLIDMLRELPVSKSEARSGVFLLDANPVMLSIARISPEESGSISEESKLPYLIMGYFLTDQKIGEAAAPFLITTLEISSKPKADSRAIPLTDTDGRVLGFITWESMGSAELDALSHFALPGLIALGLLAAYIISASRSSLMLTDQLAASERLARDASLSDDLSRLRNRLAFMEKVGHADTRKAALSGSFAVIYIDLNGFKAVNDTVGHAGGDELIRRFSARLRNTMPESAFVARLSGDEFIVLLESSDDVTATADLAGRVIALFEQPFDLGGESVTLSASVGYANATGNREPEQVVHQADVAMYHAKTTGADSAVEYNPELERNSVKKKQIEIAIRNGLAADEFQVVYQPIIRADDNTVDGVEALVRWESGDVGPISPGEFIPIAESAGLVVDIDSLVMREACALISGNPGIHLSLNMSSTLLRTPDHLERLSAVIQESGASADRIELELTEQMIVDDPETASVHLHRLRAAGFRLAIDDFGTGYTRISHLQDLPLDRLKIDGRFVTDLGRSSRANNLFLSMITLGNALDLKVVAEGIETPEQGELLAMLGCHYLQGYHFARPMPADDLRDYLEKDRTQLQVS